MQNLRHRFLLGRSTLPSQPRLFLSPPLLSSQLATAGKPTDRMSVYIESRCKAGVPTDPDAANVIEQMQERLSHVPIEEQTSKLRNEVFDSIMVKESHDYVPTMGLGVTANMLTQSKERAEYSDEDLKIICEKVEAHMTEKMTPTMNRMQDRINQMQDQMNQMQDRMNQMQDRINTLESKYENGGSSLFSDTSNEKVLEKAHSHVQQLEQHRGVDKTKQTQFYLRDEEDSEDEDEQ